MLKTKSATAPVSVFTLPSPKINFERIIGAVPQLSMLPINKLSVDPSYQRGEKKRLINFIAKDWDWRKCGAIHVSLREDGEWKIIDGQQRTAAAKLRGDIKELPALIYDEELKLHDEADIFLGLQ